MHPNTRRALLAALAPGEQIVQSIDVVGSTLVLTDRRLHIVRHGASFRPTTGIRSWTLDRELILRFGPTRRGTTRLEIGRTGRMSGVFVTGEELDAARALVAEARARAYSDR